MNNLYSTVFDENLNLLMRNSVNYNEIGGKTLLLALYDFDRFSKHDMLGQIHVPLSSVDFGQVHLEWRDLEPSKDDKDRARTKLIPANVVINNCVFLKLMTETWM